MQSTVLTPEAYIAGVPEERRAVFLKLRNEIKKNLPKGFQEIMGYGMIGYVVPHKLYPAGYHCDPKLPLPFMNLASQKNFIAVYHMGIYAKPSLLKWFIEEFAKQSSAKLDMGKSCIRFKKPENIPIKLMGELASKMTVDEWIDCYEKGFKRK
ncbi:DUF1801 domain-containing protein [Panacibacter ginsenosidivorans]|uniref:DUF1801 domain-containing protein n=1 Tax=Panacibacter ginsenosidivorans TaxID=1813871 RepID=A0A5B8V3L9_9BACT|nr:DUF1801 domain-containing protein [Panacibacter ginsenosidivorans]QEC65974.1 DUF1801 domain-containing protein [Panacibacter ginsenosidivorans]